MRWVRLDLPSRPVNWDKQQELVVTSRVVPELLRLGACIAAHKATAGAALHGMRTTCQINLSERRWQRGRWDKRLHCSLMSTIYPSSLSDTEWPFYVKVG
jgi:hypothetical protein